MTPDPEIKELLAVACEADCCFVNEFTSPAAHLQQHRRLHSAVEAYRARVPKALTIREYLAGDTASEDQWKPPREPTKEMCLAGTSQVHQNKDGRIVMVDCVAIYQAMYDAAPAQEKASNE